MKKGERYRHTVDNYLLIVVDSDYFNTTFKKSDDSVVVIGTVVCGLLIDDGILERLES